jgi:hypothetical protein
VAEESSASTEQVSASTEETSASTQQVAASAAEMGSSADALLALVGNSSCSSRPVADRRPTLWPPALEAHEAWNAKLRQAIETGECPTSVEQAGRDDACTFGKWLHGNPSFHREHPEQWQTLPTCMSSSPGSRPASWSAR